MTTGRAVVGGADAVAGLGVAAGAAHGWQRTRVARAAPARVLAFGAFLKNRACLLQGREVLWSPEHGDLGTPAACAALSESAEALLREARATFTAGGRIDAVAHDLHPDFHSTRLALEVAARLDVPAIAVQHHHAHVAVVQAEQGWGMGQARPLLGLALDGVGLGTDGLAWGGEVLRVAGPTFERVAHLPLLPLPGGDAAAREPWRLVAALLHAAGRRSEIGARLAPQVGAPLAHGVATLLARNLHCPRTSSAGRWFDAAAGALGLSLCQSHEAEAAMALEAAATAWLQANPGHAEPAAAALDLRSLVTSLLDERDAGRGAARFHIALARWLVGQVAEANKAGTARITGTPGGADVADVVLGGGCFFNRLLGREVEAGLAAAGHRVWRPLTVGVGDAGLALGQAWVAALQVKRDAAAPAHHATEPALAEEA
ncbi:MAG: carbamoyltransferase HypF [Burkholderiales bacterium]|nr:carbamoyltransferase HypF [Burkholderiales bacterium]